jgi:ABC-type phosphate transport system substrate-binding protein
MNPTSLRFAAALLLACSAAAASAQDYAAMIRQSQARQQAAVDGATQRVNGAIQQRMLDPQVQAAYQQYAWRMQQAGQRPMDFPTFTYQYIYTNGFSAAGIAHARANEAGIAARGRRSAGAAPGRGRARPGPASPA